MNKMTAKQFRKWKDKHKLTLKQMSMILKVSTPNICKYLKDSEDKYSVKIPEKINLLTRYFDEKAASYDSAQECIDREFS